MIGGARMLPIKLDLTEELAAKLRDMRLNNPVDGEILTAENLSKAIGNNRAWMSQIESRRLKCIKREDIIKVYSTLLGYDKDEALEQVESDMCSLMSKQKIGKIQLLDRQRERMRDIRKEKDIRADVLSLEIGKSQGWYTQIECGRTKKITIADLQLIADKLECSTQDILGNDKPLEDITPEELNDERNISDILSENIILRQENEMLKRKLQSIMEIINM